MFRQLTERSSTFAMKRLRIFVRTRARSSGVEQNRRWGRAFEKAVRRKPLAIAIPRPSFGSERFRMCCREPES